jgi:outer membrane protein assembly factor BamB
VDSASTYTPVSRLGAHAYIGCSDCYGDGAVADIHHAESGARDLSAFAVRDGEIVLWSLRDNTYVRSLKTPKGEPFFALAFDEEGRRLFVRGESALFGFDVDSGALLEGRVVAPGTLVGVTGGVVVVSDDESVAAYAIKTGQRGWLKVRS